MQNWICYTSYELREEYRMNKSDFAFFIRNRRKELGMTQDELADKLHVSRNVISRWENGERLPDLIMSQQLITALSVSADELYEKSSIHDDKPSHVVKNVLIGILSVILIAGLIIVPVTLSRKPTNAEKSTTEETTENNIVSTKAGRYFNDEAVMFQGNSATKIYGNVIYQTDSTGKYVKISSANVDNGSVSFLYNGKRIIIFNAAPTEVEASTAYTSSIYEADTNGNNCELKTQMPCYISSDVVFANDKMYFLGTNSMMSLQMGDRFNIYKTYCLYSISLKDYKINEILRYESVLGKMETQFFVDNNKVFFTYTVKDGNASMNNESYKQKFYVIEDFFGIGLNLQETALLDYIGVYNGKIYYCYNREYIDYTNGERSYVFCTDAVAENTKKTALIPYSQDIQDVRIVGDSIIVISYENVEAQSYDCVIKQYSMDGELINTKTLNNETLFIRGTYDDKVCYSVIPYSLYYDIDERILLYSSKIYIQDSSKFADLIFDKSICIMSESELVNSTFDEHVNVMPESDPWKGERDILTGEYEENYAWDYYIMFNGKIYGRHPGKFDVELWKKQEPEMPEDTECFGRVIPTDSFPSNELEASYLYENSLVYYSEITNEIYINGSGLWLILYELDEADYVDKNVIK